MALVLEKSFNVFLFKKQKRIKSKYLSIFIVCFLIYMLILKPIFNDINDIEYVVNLNCRAVYFQSI